jgi:hypothetical protein
MELRKPSRFELRLPPELGDEIDSWRRQQPDLPPRAEAARRLIELGLEATKGAAAPTPARRSVGPEDEARSGPEAIERPRTELDD